MGMQINTDFSTIEPDEGGRRQLPVSDSRGWLVRIVKSEPRETSNKKGSMLFMELEGMEGAIQGHRFDYSENVQNESTDAVRIGLARLSAIAHVLGHTRVGNSEEWHGKPFRVVVALAKDQEKYPGSTNVVAIKDVNGNSPKAAGQGVMTAGTVGGGGFGGNPGQAAQGFGGGQPQGGGQWGGGQPQGNPQGGNFQQGNPQQGGFGGQPQGGGFQQGNPQQGNPQGGFQPQGNAGGFQQGNFDPSQGQQGGGFQSGQQNGAPSWNR